MERSEYLAEVQRIQLRARGQVSDLARVIFTRPWRLGRTATELADVYAASVAEIRQLSPPPGDVADLEAHFLGPLDAQTRAVSEWAKKVRSDFRRLRMRKALRGLRDLGVIAGRTDPEDLVWCQRYGLGA